MPQFLITQFSVADSFLKERKKRRKKKERKKENLEINKEK